MTLDTLILLNTTGIGGALVGIGFLIFRVGRFTQKVDDHIIMDEKIMNGVSARLKNIEEKI
jgi:hypothetical protein